MTILRGLFIPAESQGFSYDPAIHLPDYQKPQAFHLESGASSSADRCPRDWSIPSRRCTLPHFNLYISLGTHERVDGAITGVMHDLACCLFSIWT